MVIKKNDFIAIEYTGRLKDGRLFDTTDEKIAKEENVYNKDVEYGEIVICIGQDHILSAIDNTLLNKKIGEDVHLELEAENGFGKRNPNFVKLVRLEDFKDQKINPYPGLVVMIDNKRGTVLRVSGGRIMVDFNHPLAGRSLIYDIKIKRKIEDLKDQVNSLIERELNLKNTNINVEENTVTISFNFDLPDQIKTLLTEKINNLTSAKKVKFEKSN